MGEERKDSMQKFTEHQRGFFLIYFILFELRTSATVLWICFLFFFFVFSSVKKMKKHLKYHLLVGFHSFAKHNWERVYKSKLVIQASHLTSWMTE